LRCLRSEPKPRHLELTQQKPFGQSNDDDRSSEKRHVDSEDHKESDKPLGEKDTAERNRCAQDAIGTATPPHDESAQPERNESGGRKQAKKLICHAEVLSLMCGYSSTDNTIKPRP
jgi:hypothetical protein